MPPTHPAAPFSGSVLDGDGHALLTVAGEIDLATSPKLVALLGQALATGAERVIVDMSAVDFMDAQGLGALVASAVELRLAGRRLVVCGVPEHIFALFAITREIDVGGVEVMAGTASLLPGLTGIAAIPMALRVLDVSLQAFVELAHEFVPEADGVSITLPRQGRLATVAASNDVVLGMDQDQYSTGEGPCLDAAQQGRRVQVDSLPEEVRWPRFIPRARVRGIHSILSTPLRAEGQTFGALNIYSRTGEAFSDIEQRWAEAFAARAATVVSRAELGADALAMAGSVAEALASRHVIAMAQGVLVARKGVSPDRAHALLRELSRKTGRPLREVCEGVLATAAGRRAAPEGPNGSADA
ncbi:MAG: GAF domain-containing protein [Actinomycetota bacterium]|nr:GAF domain-containing protein [Actinomycetota bacterium]